MQFDHDATRINAWCFGLVEEQEDNNDDED
jgi:hypothetical protein